MIIWAITATAAAIIAIGILTVYRRQIRKNCRQLEFLKEHQTNMNLTSDLPFRELEALADGVNDVLEMSREIKKASKQSEDSLKEMITNLSHDIRTPLTSMDGYFQLLAHSDTEEERQHYIAVIRSRITSLKDMLEELFMYTKLQNAAYEPETEPLDFGKCTFDTVFSFYDEFQRKGIEPRIDFCEEKLPIIGNYEAIRRVLQNIVKNTLEHGERKIEFVLRQDNGRAVFCCSNDMKGSDKLDAGQVFSRFYKADVARGSSSTGLGLSIAKGLTEKMGGEIRAELNKNIFSVEVSFSLREA